MVCPASAPCQCLSPASIQTESPAVIICAGLPASCTRPTPVNTCKACPMGWVCHAVRAPGSNETRFTANLAGAAAATISSIHTVPVNQSCGPLRQPRISLGSIFIFLLRLLSPRAQTSREKLRQFPRRKQRRQFHHIAIIIFLLQLRGSFFVNNSSGVGMKLQSRSSDRSGERPLDSIRYSGGLCRTRG